TDGLWHLLIGMRALAAGPTVTDEMGNAAFFFGLMYSVDEEYGDVSRMMPFDDAKENFLAASRSGLKAQFTWLRGKRYTATGLVLDHLLPLARIGLKQAGIDDSDRYLDTIEERVRRDQTGAQWSLKSLAAMDSQSTPDSRHRALAKAMLANQLEGKAVHEWPEAKLEDDSHSGQAYRNVGQFMSTDLFTVRPDDLVDLVAS